ncbi:hypothetical protein MG293_018564 [Ovis ammon polii]|uniref:Uncharacterized protein n=1 Tax=Ovis ammon polii TaxID=230172 RepID=A0AAD4TTG2_OVIAM|nr:hypothetical protein MG293_018564 [Ovis ammon polii]
MYSRLVTESATPTCLLCIPGLQESGPLRAAPVEGSRVRPGHGRQPTRQGRIRSGEEPSANHSGSRHHVRRSSGSRRLASGAKVDGKAGAQSLANCAPHPGAPVTRLLPLSGDHGSHPACPPHRQMPQPVPRHADHRGAGAQPPPASDHTSLGLRPFLPCGYRKSTGLSSPEVLNSQEQLRGAGAAARTSVSDPTPRSTPPAPPPDPERPKSGALRTRRVESDWGADQRWAALSHPASPEAAPNPPKCVGQQLAYLIETLLTLEAAGSSKLKPLKVWGACNPREESQATGPETRPQPEQVNREVVPGE